MLEIALEDAIRGGYAYIGTEHLLAGILREGNNMAVRLLRSAGVDARQLYTALMEKVSAAPPYPKRRRCPGCRKRRGGRQEQDLIGVYPRFDSRRQNRETGPCHWP